MKNLITRIFALAIIIIVLFQIQDLTAQTLAPFPAKYSFVNGAESGKHKNSVNEVIIPSQESEYVSAGFLPIHFDNISKSIQSIGLGKNHLLMISVCLTAFFLVISHKNKFETDIYEFYHRTPKGELIFENVDEAQTHEFKSFLALSMKIMGLLSALTVIILLVF